MGNCVVARNAFLTARQAREVVTDVNITRLHSTLPRTQGATDSSDAEAQLGRIHGVSVGNPPFTGAFMIRRQ